MPYFFNTFIQLFALLSPFGSAAVFLASTSELTDHDRRKAALRAILAVVIITIMVFLTGAWILGALGISLDAFRIGTGSVLLLSAISIIRGAEFFQQPRPGEDFAVVPFAIPITVGPGTIGYLIVISSEVQNWELRLQTLLALFAVIFILLLLLYYCDLVVKIIGKRGLAVTSKLFGLILSAMAAQIIMDGIRNYLHLPVK